MFEEARIAPHVITLKDDLVGDVQNVLWVLMATIGLVLLIACANVANLLLVRAESRQQELAIRAALGAGTGRIAREMLLESVSLALLGGLIGLGLAFGGLRLLVALAPGNIPRLADIGLDLPVLLFTLVISVAAGLLFGAIPVFKYARGRVGIGASRRRADRDVEPGSAPRAQQPGRGAGGAGARAAGQLGADVQDVRGAARRQSRLHPARAAADVPPLDSRLPDQGGRGGGAAASGHSRQARRRPRRDVGCARLDRHHDRQRLARSALRA